MALPILSGITLSKRGAECKVFQTHWSDGQQMLAGISSHWYSSRMILIIRSLVLCCCSLFALAAENESFDVVVYGGTAGGALAAVAAASEGVSVVLLEPGGHLGGMLTGGLGRTDMDRQQHVIGGLALQFFRETGKHYGQDLAWTFEPKVAEKILNSWVEDAGVEVRFHHRLAAVEKSANQIRRIQMVNGTAFEARVFIDSSYEGDLMARTGVSYTVGRESRKKYGESLAGIKEIQPGNHQLLVPVSPYDDAGQLLPYLVDERKVDAIGEGDDKVQAYCFRLCLSKVEENQVPFPKPADYNPKQFELLRRYLVACEQRFGRAFNPLGISEVPHGKTDVNSGGPISTNLLGASWEYPEAGYTRRQEIWNEHMSWTQGLLYFLANDTGVPEYLRQEMKGWGLAKDEFRDTDHWPHQLYVREARRMCGEHIMTQHDLEERREKFDSIGMGGYNMDVREVQWVAKMVYRFPVPKKEVLMEGYITVNVDPYQIPYRALLPLEHECSNLLVTSCVSASHMAYSSIRMEPQYMIMGQSAGVAAAMAVEKGLPVHKVGLVQLQRRLQGLGQILSLE